MNKYYSDLGSVSNTLQKVVPQHESGKVVVVQVEGIAVGLTTEEMSDRNLHSFSEEVCSIRWEGADGDIGPVKLTIGFHEKQLESKFTFQSSGGRYTRLNQLSSNLQKVEDEIIKLGLSQPDFAEIDSASMSTHMRDGLCDREFKYEVIAHLVEFE